MEIHRTNPEQGRANSKPSERGSYETVNIGTLKNIIASLMLGLKGSKVKSEAIPVHIHQGKTKKKRSQIQGEKTHRIFQ